MRDVHFGCFGNPVKSTSACPTCGDNYNLYLFNLEYFVELGLERTPFKEAPGYYTFKLSYDESGEWVGRIKTKPQGVDKT